MKVGTISAESQPPRWSAWHVAQRVLAALFQVSIAALIAATVLCLSIAAKGGVAPLGAAGRFFVFMWLVALGVAWLHALLLGVPAALLLRRIGAYRAAPMCVAGALIGSVPAVWIGQMNVWLLAIPVSGVAGAWAFYLVSRTSRSSHGRPQAQAAI